MQPDGMIDMPGTMTTIPPSILSRPLSCTAPTKVLGWRHSLACARAPRSDAMLLRTIILVVTVAATWGRRVPKVYNALITSGDNLAPSRAYPVFQPVIQEMAYGIPLQPTFVFGDGQFKEIAYQPYPVDSIAEKSDSPPAEPVKPDEKTLEVTAKATDKTEVTSEAKPAPETASEKPAQESPIKLNEFGLPPSLIPVQAYNPATIPYSYNPYNAYYPEFYGSPTFSTYNTYPGFPLSPYAFPSYSFPAQNHPIPEGTFFQQPESPARPHEDTAVPGAAANEPAPTVPTVAPANLDIQNISNKQPGIPDVPPPPLPKGGLKP